ncbi:DUF3325 domain-containing protein [Diaphorobacter ruginosibacter]|uniref:DUF3325 domain-containing protein n=1 Tax=Diaphorobacter ruginosibacter TaxID=1715720 RepID=A0A7G9RJQ5_9BURK|nr:DUF3325 domain-containing protein [Diaphorobacter ruginosibacter]QNN55830.1 DUF3325 domain-containing protein [Diaphorobacter ruginosibacter]
MTPDVQTGTHLMMLVLGLAGLLSLAFASERHGEHLLGRMPDPRWRWSARAAGWLLLALSLALGMAAMGAGIGSALWLGWLSIAGLAWVFVFPHWPWRPALRERPPRVVREGIRAEAAAFPDPARRMGRRIAAVLLVFTIVPFAVGVSRVQIPPLERPDAIQGQIGPWAFTLAESDRKAPEIVDMDIPMKEFRLRFCDECDRHIRQATLKVNRPRSERATGMGFVGQRWERKAEIPLPATLRADSELWLTVTGKDGSVHQASWRMDKVSPATVAWFEQQRSAHAIP